ncbi:MAG TPA: hypothetical protein VN755_08865, partial [Steroidobacteraceae bacterium]|nr:hypothetical protein [Steroidobacteraceae bacterium]
ISLVSPDESSFLKDIVRLLGRDVPTQPLPAFEMKEPTTPSTLERYVDPRRAQAPQRQGRPGGGGGQRPARHHHAGSAQPGRQQSRRG